MDPLAEVISAIDAVDVRFPTSLSLDGSDAMNPEPDYSAAYVTIRTSDGDEGYGLAFTVGRGNDVEVAAVRALVPLVVGMPVSDALADLGAFSRRLTGDSQLRWLGPDKGAIHMAAAAIVNAAWDLRARREGKPVWRLLAEMPPEELVGLVDFRYLQDALTPGEALDILRRAEPGRAARQAELLDSGFPAYTTTPGWLGYSPEKLAALAKEAVEDGFTQIKLKVGADLDEDVRRLRLAREVVGPDVRIAIDANQAWGVGQAIEWLRPLAEFDPYWIEEPTSPDDVLGHAAIRRAVAPIKVATGEHTHNAVMFKQLLQAEAIDVLQLDASRVAGVTENVAILLLAAKFGVPVCPHAGGVGLCEMVQHLAMFDFVAVSGTQTDRVIEYVDHLHEHFVDPVRIERGRYLAPVEPGLGARLHTESVARYRFPDGPVWQRDAVVVA
ncbi:mandelate racemase [Amycolatopsis mediterranei S699]|uniref:L-fuconate dehydratase n=2 Tax=Amycolatopsis mediterranei TaxID=33910 RepID=A0A0H3D5R3_AMYMU|nr:mandelate racemase [Amycolatopsis mediterranei U32]AEK41628.1 mandelate racemase [Amycolatopsis mediterranei S699]AGT83718.1 mandelate racemase [Amycolatopsis mediterranei RB]KDO07296.1 fuconate dehydratase [Amycolatopsis mediterranei]AFO76589.1 mandelate racemase [Amycolatopsis mediterranei S699]